MKIDPNTTLRDLVAALPSAQPVLERLRILGSERDERTLGEACAQANVSLEEFLNRLDKVDWDTESGQYR